MERAARPGDRGNGIVVGCIGPSGRLLYVGTAHPVHGFVELTAAPHFAERDRFDPQAVRGYRDRLVDERFAVLEVTGAATETMTWAEPGEHALRQRWWVPGAASVRLRFAGRLQPPTLAEITEAGVQPLVRCPTTLRTRGMQLIVEAPEMPASAIVSVSIGSGAAGGWVVDGATATLDVECGGPTIVDVCCGLVPSTTPSTLGAPASRLIMPDRLRADLHRLRDTALRYVTDCTALRVDDDTVCLLADHRLLPLGWIRDAYYQAALLLGAGSAPLVAAHLRWVWTRAVRRDGRWLRSYLPNGHVKDARFQADQQLYPLLELADYVRAVGMLPELPGVPADGLSGRWSAFVRAAWNALPVCAGLVPTEENAADDPQPLPYVVSVQLLRCHIAGRMRLLEDAGVLDTGVDFAVAGAESRDALARFVTDGPSGPMWAYAIDDDGQRRSYHDANDLPTAFAPMWGVCAADDPIWQATMRFAFSADNPGYAPGRHGGLGSVHTPGTWPLGDLQEWVWASVCGDWARVSRVLTRLLGAAYPDGMLPEAYEPNTGRPTARPWFAWPGSAFGALMALHCWPDGQ